MDADQGRSATRLYGGAIAVVSGAYSLLLAWTGMGAGAGVAGAAMLLLGAVVLVHGVVLFTDAAERLAGASGPLMVGYAILMLLLQGWSAVMGPMMDGGMGDGGMRDGGGMDGGVAGAGTMEWAMGWDPGMVALAVVMLASGLIMTSARASRAG